MIGSENIGVLGQLPQEKLLSNPKNNPNPNLNHNWGTIFLGDNCLVFPNPKTNPNLDQNPNPKQGAIFLGGGGGAIVWIPVNDISLIFKCIKKSSERSAV